MTSAFGGQHSIQLSYGRVVRGPNDKGSGPGKASAARLPQVSSWRNGRAFPAQDAVARLAWSSHAMACTVAGRVSAIGAGGMLLQIDVNI